MLRSCLCTLALAATIPAAAQDHSDRPWSASVELGAISTSGNTETTSIQSKLDARHNAENWKNEFNASLLFKEDDVMLPDGSRTTQKTAERYFLSAKSGYKLNSSNSNIFVFGSHTQDEFGAFERYSTASLGYGTRWFDTPTTYLDLEIGPGYFRGERVTGPNTTEVEQGAIVRGALEYRWAFTDTATFNQKLSIEAGSDNTRTISDTSVATRISGSLQMKVGYSVSHNSEVAPGKEGTDTTTFINLVYNL